MGLGKDFTKHKLFKPEAYLACASSKLCEFISSGPALLCQQGPVSVTQCFFFKLWNCQTKLVKQSWSYYQKKLHTSNWKFTMKHFVKKERLFWILSCFFPQQKILNFHNTQCHSIRHQTPIFQTPPKSYATIFWGVHRTLFWSNK